MLNGELTANGTMKTKSFAVLALTFLCVLNFQLSTARAQNTVFTYQGRELDNGTNFNGTGQFQFALVTSTNANHTATATANFSAPFVTSYNVTYGGNGYIIETTPHGVQSDRVLLNQIGSPPGSGALFGLAVVPHGKGVYFVDDDLNQLRLFH